MRKQLRTIPVKTMLTKAERKEMAEAMSETQHVTESSYVRGLILTANQYRNAAFGAKPKKLLTRP